METLDFTKGQNFSSPQEELAFLRAHILEREKVFKNSGLESSREAITEAALEQYKNEEAQEILNVAHRLPEHKVEALVLRLQPEVHDRKMEELLGILSETGIKNTLSVVQELHDPHVDDDFHRFLVQYLATTKTVPGLKENSPVYKGIAMRLLEVTLPEDVDEKKNFKDFIVAMEQFYAGMLSVGDDRTNIKERYFTLEIAQQNAGTEVRFYAAVPFDKVGLFEKQVLGFYHDAKVEEIADDYNIFSENGSISGSYAKFTEVALFPIRMVESGLDHDPMNTIVNAFSKLKEEGEGAAIQFTIMPVGDTLVKQYSEALHNIKKEGMKAKEALSAATSLLKGAGNAFKDLFTSSEELVRRKEENKTDEKVVEAVTTKVKSTLMKASIRIIASARTKERAEEIRTEIEATFNQFTDTNANSFSWHRVGDKHTDEFAYDFSFRQFHDQEALSLNTKELATLFHFPVGVKSSPNLRQARAASAPAPSEMLPAGISLGTNTYRGETKEIIYGREDRVRHCYVIGQTGTGKTVFLKNMIIQDIQNGDGVCFIDPHGSDIVDILANIPPERIDDVIYFDPAYTERPMGLNMLEYDPRFPEQKTFVVNELLAIFNKLFDMKTAGGPAFEQYFRNSALLVMDDPLSGATLLEIGRVLADKEFRDLKLSTCKNPIIKQFWENAEKTSGEQSLANFVPYVTNKFDVFISNDIMRPVIAQPKSVLNFREIMDKKKILLVNLSKGRLGDINANLIGLILVGKITMAALSRVDIVGKEKVNDFYLYIDEFQNITTDSIEVILSEARKYRLSLNIAHQYIEQLEDNIRDAVFGNVGTMIVHRVSPENADVFAKTLEPTFTPQDIIKLENLNCYVKMLVNGMPVKPFNSKTPFPPKGNREIIEKLKQLSYLKFGRPREEVEAEIMERYKAQF